MNDSASSPPVVDEGDAPDLRFILREMVAPSWTRLRATVQVLVPMLAVLAIWETFRIPQPGIAVFLLLMIARGDASSTVGSSVTAAISVSLGALLAVVVLALSLSEPALRVPIMALMVFTTMILVRGTTLGPIAFLIGFFSINGITLADEMAGLSATQGDITNTEGSGRPQGAFMPPEEALLHALLWLSMVAVLPGLMLAITARAIGADPRTLLLKRFRARSDAAARFCRGEPGAPERLQALARGGIAPLLDLVRIAERSGGTTALHDVHLQLVRGFNRLVLLLVAWTMARPADIDDAPFLRPVGLFTAALAGHLRPGGVAAEPLPPPPPEAVDDALGGALFSLAAAIRRALDELRAAEAARAQALRPRARAGRTPRRPFWQPNAFGAANIRFALKVTLTVMTAYLIEMALDWQAISTCMVSCLFVALGTVGETVHKMTLRIAGCLVGATPGIGSILVLVPAMTGFGDLVALFLPVAFLSAWIAFGSPRIAYAGWQMLLAFALTVLQGYGPTLDMQTARDRVIGILLGNLVIALVFIGVWPVRVGDAVRRDMAAALETLGRLMALGGDPATKARHDTEAGLRDSFSAAIARVDAVIPNDRFEPSTARRPDGRSDRRSGSAPTGRIGRDALARLSRLVVPVSVIATDGVDADQRDAMPSALFEQTEMFHRAMADWFGRAALWIRTGDHPEQLRASLPFPPPAPSLPDTLSPALVRRIAGRIALYDLLQRQIADFLDAALPPVARSGVARAERSPALAIG